MTNTERVRAFIAAWEARDLEAILGALSSQAIYENVGLSITRGRDEARAFLQPFLAGASAVRWSVHQIAETVDGVVLTERTDVFEMADRTLTIPVMGRFTFDEDGLIAEWRDYFDVIAFRAQMEAA